MMFDYPTRTPSPFPYCAGGYPARRVKPDPPHALLPDVLQVLIHHIAGLRAQLSDFGMEVDRYGELIREAEADLRSLCAGRAAVLEGPDQCD